MSAFDATIRVGDASVIPIEDNGKFHEAHLILGVLGLAPIGPGQAIPIPFGQLRVPLDKASTKSLIDELQAVYDKLEHRPDIQIASSLEGLSGS